MHRALFVAFCWGVLLVAPGLIVIGFLWSDRDQPEVQVDKTSSSTRPLREAVLTPTAPLGLDGSTIRAAMVNCEAEAAKNPYDLYFFLTPVVPANFESATLLLPPGENYGSFFLIQSQAALEGLKDGSLELSTRPYKFSVIDIVTTRIQKWASTRGPSNFTQPNAVAIEKFQIGLNFGDQGMKLTKEYERQKAICYWVNVFFRGQYYSPPSGRVNLTESKSFPNQARTLRCANRACEPDTDQ